MTESSTFSSPGVEQIHATGQAVIDLRSGWPTREQLLDGGPGPLWDVDAPLDRLIEVSVIGPRGTLRVEATTIRLHVGADGVVSVVGLTRSFDDPRAAADEIRRTADVVALPEEPTETIADRVAAGAAERRRRLGLLGGEALGVRVGLAVHRLPARGDVPALEILEWSVTPAGAGGDGIDEVPTTEAGATEDRTWLRL